MKLVYIGGTGPSSTAIQSQGGTEHRLRRCAAVPSTLRSAWKSLAAAASFPFLAGGLAGAQVPAALPLSPGFSAAAATTVHRPAATGAGLAAIGNYAGRTIGQIQFSGVDPSMIDPLPSQLPVQANSVLDPARVRESLRQLYATGLYQTIEVFAVPTGDESNSVNLLFTGTKKLFVGRVVIEGVKNDNLLAQLNGSTKLDPGTVYSEGKLLATDGLLKQTLEDNGYYEGTIQRTLDTDVVNGLVNVHYSVNPGTLARVGTIRVEGASGLTLAKFRRKAGLRKNARVSRNTVSSALSGLQRLYQKEQRLAATITLVAKSYDAQGQYLNLAFNVDPGPLVKVSVTGVKLSKAEIEKFVPIYQEGAVDVDLINEGAHNIRDYLQSKGYFDATVVSRPPRRTPGEIDLQYVAEVGVHHRVQSVSVRGNKYFDTQTIQEHISVYAASFLDRDGGYSQSMVDADIANIKSLYQGNGFSEVKIEAKVENVENKNKPRQEGLLSVTYEIDEGPQQKIGEYRINGNKGVALASIAPLLNTQVGQPYSSLNLVGDRDTVLNYYLAHGYDKAQVSLTQEADARNSGLVNVSMNITEGPQFLVRDVLTSGIRATRQSTVQQQVGIRADKPLDESELLLTQRKLYNLALFNQVNTAIQNPSGDELKKNVLLQLTEAKRWDVTYGFGFQAQTGTPSHNCLNPVTLISLGINPSTYNCYANGKVGASPEVLFNVSRINLGGTQQSITLNTSYGTLEQIALITYNNPELLRNSHFNFSLSGGYTNSQNVTTYSATVEGASVRVSEKVNRANTLLYSLTFRDVKVNADSIQVNPSEIPLLSEPVRVSGPGLTWIRDTRDDPLDAHRGTFNTFATFFSSSKFGSQSNFGRLDASNSTYYPFGGGWVFARQTRYAQERSFGEDSQKLIPLPERLYAGGAQSLRGFSFNAAGPRDPDTGFPIGGAAAFVNSLELRTPSPHLPYVGNSLGFVLFHDMGNVFDKSSDIWPSLDRVGTPTPAACRNLSTANTTAGPDTAIGQQGGCSFNYFTHDLGIGFRYHTPIGPVRLDVSYLLNPPVYPVVVNYTTSTSTTLAPATVGIASNFKFFFSIGQMF